ncbi:adhesion G-protein coupled receptor G6-like, partial [Galleria mellonella]|uniref:Adhesion G-protein coupled receptor G6-like n=1 Tax=Galleria mellonella TaxID=7137 RepID=A0ABM3MAY2_GALME
MIPVESSKIEGGEILFMKPVYYCNKHDVKISLSMNYFTSKSRCNTYKCVGNFDEGVSLVTEGTIFNPEHKNIGQLNNKTNSIFGSKTSTLTPEDQLEQVLNDLDTLLQDDVSTIMVDKIDDTFDRVDNLLQIDEDLHIPGQFLHMLDNVSLRLNLNGRETDRIVRNNIALLVADIGPDNPIKGIMIAVRNSSMNSFTDDSFQFLVKEINSTKLLTNTTETIVYLPESITKSHRRISFLVFPNGRAFYSTKRNNKVNSNVISVNVENNTGFENEEVIDIYLRPLVKNPGRNVRRECSYWQFTENDTGYWSTEGCIYIKSTDPDTLDICRCNHLTHFAEVLVSHNVNSHRSEIILEVISLVGCCLSILGVFFIVLTAITFRSWRKEFSNLIWLQLCIAIFLLKMCFIPIAFIDFEGRDILCLLVGITLHYTLIATFCWMLVAAILSYRKLVLVFTTDLSHKFLKASAFAWGTPFLIVVILLSVDWHSYMVYFEDITLNRKFCYPSGYGLCKDISGNPTWKCSKLYGDIWIVYGTG